MSSFEESWNVLGKLEGSYHIAFPDRRHESVLLPISSNVA